MPKDPSKADKLAEKYGKLALPDNYRIQTLCTQIMTCVDAEKASNFRVNLTPLFDGNVRLMYAEGPFGGFLNSAKMGIFLSIPLSFKE